MRILKYNDFVESLLEKVDGTEVCIFPGRFQPFHNGHILALERTVKHFNVPVIPIQIFSKTEESPFPTSLLEKMGKAVAKEFPFIEDYQLYPPGKKTVIPQMVKFLQELGYNPIGIGCGSDRLADYERQVAYLTSPKSDVKVDRFSVAMVDERVSDGPSGTRVRQAIIDDNQDLFRKLTPRGIHPFYSQMYKELSK